MYQYTTQFYAYSTYFLHKIKKKTTNTLYLVQKNLYVIFLNLNVFSAKNIKFIEK